jgi:hypothetical protein
MGSLARFVKKYFMLLWNTLYVAYYNAGIVAVDYKAVGLAPVTKRVCWIVKISFPSIDLVTWIRYGTHITYIIRTVVVGVCTYVLHKSWFACEELTIVSPFFALSRYIQLSVTKINVHTGKASLSPAVKQQLMHKIHKIQHLIQNDWKSN